LAGGIGVPEKDREMGKLVDTVAAASRCYSCKRLARSVFGVLINGSLAMDAFAAAW